MVIIPAGPEAALRAVGTITCAFARQPRPDQRRGLHPRAPTPGRRAILLSPGGDSCPRRGVRSSRSSRATTPRSGRARFRGRDSRANSSHRRRQLLVLAERPRRRVSSASGLELGRLGSGDRVYGAHGGGRVRPSCPAVPSPASAFARRATRPRAPDTAAVDPISGAWARAQVTRPRQPWPLLRCSSRPRYSDREVGRAAP